MLCSTLVVILSLFVLAGTSYSRVESRIVGGEITLIKKFPHSVFLFTMCGKLNFMCVASVVNQLMILTAGHCVHIPSLVKSCKVNVMAGHEELIKVRYLRRTKKILLHEKFNVTEMVNDIALAYLNEKLPLGQTIQRVIITKDTPNVHHLFVAGWGSTGSDKPNAEIDSKKLKSVKQYLIPRKECSKELGSGINFNQGMICAIFSATDYVSNGDYGSALVSSNGHQVGVTSFNLIKGRPGMTVYTNTSYYYNWILTTAEKLHCSVHDRVATFPNRWLREAMAEIRVILVNGCCLWGPVCSRLQGRVFQLVILIIVPDVETSSCCSPSHYF